MSISCRPAAGKSCEPKVCEEIRDLCDLTVGLLWGDMDIVIRQWECCRLIWIF